MKAVAIGSLRRFKRVNGNHLAGSITLSGFLSLFPLLLLGVALLGFVAAGRVDLAADVSESLGLGPDLTELVDGVIDGARDSRGTLTVASGLALLWSGLRVVEAMQFALNTAWGIETRRGLKARVVGLAWLGGVGGLFLASLAASGAAAALLPGPLASLGLVVGLALDTLLWLWTFRVLVNNDQPWRAHLPGAVLGAVGTGLLKAVGSFWLPRSVASASELYGSIGVVFALLLWLLLFGRLVVLAAVLNAVASGAVDLSPPDRPAPIASSPHHERSVRQALERTRTAARRGAG